MKRELDSYMRFRYPYELERDGKTGTFFARHVDLPGCAAQGASPDEAVHNLDAARRLWIRTRLEDGLHVPEPPEDEPSGRVSLRMSTGLHAELNRVASRSGVSLNLLLNTILADYVGRFDYREELRELGDAIRGAVPEQSIRSRASPPPVRG